MKGIRTMNHAIGNRVSYMASQSTLHDIHKVSFASVLGQKARQFSPCMLLDSVVAYEPWVGKLKGFYMVTNLGMIGFAVAGMKLRKTSIAGMLLTVHVLVY